MFEEQNRVRSFAGDDSGVHLALQGPSVFEVDHLVAKTDMVETQGRKSGNGLSGHEPSLDERIPTGGGAARHHRSKRARFDPGLLSRAVG
jgi:hypothetical protein